ncbi:hypothetical protein GCM10009798_29760 [Nocardioides panacihumi]|uniref:Nuclear transport factor 2 family protein n=1 Tax=Nocardioides panacihumi TaxID=400774 RepID=A0ABN2RDX4_9ACTN
MSALAAVLACGIALAGCSGGSDEKPAGGGATSTPSPSAEPAKVTTQAAVATVTGNLGAARRETLAAAVAKVVDGWLDGAYLGDFPRADYKAAFAGFTPGAAGKAQRDLALMTNSAISDRITKAEATKRSISLDVLSVKQRAVGVTATVDLTFETTGALAGAQEITGTLDLTPDGAGWKIFGFDISRRQA